MSTHCEHELRPAATPGTDPVVAGLHPRSATRLAGLIPVAIALLVLVAFIPALENGFVDWDDSTLITTNDAYRGLGWAQVSWMFSNVLLGHYVPITWLTLGFDYVVWGMDSKGYHLTSLLLHAANAALFYLVALRLLGAATTRWPTSALRLAAVASALFFGLHPLRAESVAWVTERRDVLSGVFFFATVLLYLEGHRAERARRCWWWHALACVTYLLAILSKSMVMTLPAVLVVLDVYPLRRISLDGPAWWRRIPASFWREKLAYLALGALAAILGAYGQAANGFLTSLERLPWTERPALVVYSLWFYVSKTFVPRGLAALYELPERIDPLAWAVLGPALAVVVLTVAVVLLRRRWPALLAVWIAYVIMVLPVSGALHAGYQLAHDRYSYLSCLGWALLVGAAVALFSEACRRDMVSAIVARAGAASIVIAFLGLAALGWQQVQAWRDTETLWYSALDAQRDCAICETNLGAHLFKQRLFTAARPHYERAVALRPNNTKYRQNLGTVLAELGDARGAMIQFQHVVRDRPGDVPALLNLGVALMRQGRAADGLGYLRRSAWLAPKDYLVLSNFGLALTETGNATAALPVLERAIAVKPAGVEARHALVVTQLALRDAPAARAAHAALEPVDPDGARRLAPLVLERR
jgi:tetratricopeptide (TPR) repeat protein